MAPKLERYYKRRTTPEKDKDQDQVILVLFSLFYVTKINPVLLELNCKYSKRKRIADLQRNQTIFG
jgi:hypothetical protein